MIKLMAAAFVLAASPALALPLTSPSRPDNTVIMVREACGAGFQRVGGACVRNTTARTVRRCAAGMRLVNGRCIR